MMSDDPLCLRWATPREILAQPGIWRDWAGRLDLEGLRAWIAAQDVEEIWFCGAGTSAYIGEVVVSGLEGGAGPRLRAIATTDMVSRPAAYLTGARPLVVSFGRSGNSAETLGTLDALDALAPEAPRLNITCNPDGALATRGPGQAVILPEATHDSGFAMTSSFTTMLLTALALFSQDGVRPVAGLAAAAEATLAAHAKTPPPERAVYVGAGPLAFAARECALKVMELTAGQVPALWDSSLGFRHGPKSFVRGDTAITVLLSSDPGARRYDDDLVAELRAQFPAARVLGQGPGGDPDLPATHGDAWAAMLQVLPAQLDAVRWSDALGLDVDDPFRGQGTLSRVVSGVTLYPVEGAA